MSAPATDPRYVCGIDIGGTFTDCAVVDRDGGIVTAKVPSTPANPDVAFLDALASAARTLDVDLDELLRRSDHVMHGTTVATNAVVERRGARVGLLATAGHGEAILVMRGAGRTAGVSIERMLDVPGSHKPEPLVPRRLIREIVERVDCDGDVVVALDEDAARTAIGELLAEGVDAIAVALLWSFMNPAHERRLRELVREQDERVYVSLSSEIAPVMGEYERTVAAVLNSYVGPVTNDYLQSLAGRIGDAGFAREVLIVQSSGGVVPARRAASEALMTLGSGPVAGMIGTSFLGDVLGLRDVIAVDMGGTSFDVGIVHDGRPLTVDASTVDQYEYTVPNVEVRSIGAGGGSIASVDEVSGGLLVGPASAGAEPGPACYGRGGEQATVTDADLLLGYLDADYFLGGAMKLDRRRAERAVDAVAERVGLERSQTAAGIVKVVEHRMADLIRAMTVQRGLDPRDFALFVYGGAGGTHGAVLARELGIAKVVVPMGTVAGVWSALGAATADVLHVLRRSHPQLGPFDPARLQSTYDELERDAREELREQGFGDEDIALRRQASVRYRYQIHEIEVDVAPGALDARAAAKIVEDFEAGYAAQYGEGSGFAAAGVELTNLKVLAHGRLPQVGISRNGGSRNGAAPSAGEQRSREVFDPDGERFVTARVLRGDQLSAGAQIAGPAVVEQDWTTILVPSEATARVDELGNLIITLGKEDE